MFLKNCVSVVFSANVQVISTTQIQVTVKSTVKVQSTQFQWIFYSNMLYLINFMDDYKYKTRNFMSFDYPSAHSVDHTKILR